MVMELSKVWPELLQLTLVASAVGTVANTIAKTSIFSKMRVAIYRRSEWFGELVRCPLCLSHWLCLFALFFYPSFPVYSSCFLADCAVSWFLMVLVSSIAVGIIKTAFSGMKPSDFDEIEAILTEKYGPVEN